MVDAPGHPLGFFRAAGDGLDPVAAEHRPPDMQADTPIADKAFAAAERVAKPPAAAGESTKRSVDSTPPVTARLRL